jgi:ADP-heptose:LPS heptosyltransferase
VVTWGPGEEALVDAVLAACPGAVRAPPTTLDQLASLMRGAKVTVCNNTGPMHLSVAVGCPTLALFLHMEVERWGHPYAPHQMLDLTGAADQSAAVRQAVLELPIT